MTWKDDALCTGYNPELWFAHPVHNPDNYQFARDVCAACPVTTECLDLAMRNEHGSSWGRWGIYGGLDPHERARLARRARRGGAA